MLTVPILVSKQQLQSIPAEQLFLCYEVHGTKNKWFNLISDKCASVNAHYTGLGPWLNVIDKIAVRAIDGRQQCVNISVSIENNCSAVVNGEELTRYLSGGVSVRAYNNRVRISVPNCNDLTLVMWVKCQLQDFRTFDDLLGTVTRRNIKFVVTRGLNYGNRLAHGLIGTAIAVTGTIKPATYPWPREVV